MQPKTYVCSFDDLLLDAVEQSLTELLGRKAREALFDHLARNSLLPRGDISKNPAKLSTLLRNVFGRGEIMIEKHIVRSLYTDLHCQYQDGPNFDFQTQIEAAKRSWDGISETSTKSESMNQLPTGSGPRTNESG